MLLHKCLVQNDQRFQAKTDFDEGNTGVAEPNGSSAADESRRLCGIVFLSFAKFDAAGRSISPLMHLEKMLVDGFGYDVDEASRVLDDVQRSYYIDDSGRRFVVRFRTPKVADEVMSQANKLSDYKPHGRHVAIEHVMNKKQTDDKRVLLRAMKILRRCGKFASLEWTGRLGYVLNCDNLKFVSTLSFGYPFCVFHIDCLNIHSY
ncbi:hypothetical protein AAVH_18757 [Aphelenchoides avenae]|nr:hypothetical protein AAVH_18757 [Aphelenchus avenae]